MTSIEEALRSGAVRLVPVEATDDMLAHGDEAMVDTIDTDNWLNHCRNAYNAMLSAAPDHTPALLALIEERDRLKVERDEATRGVGFAVDKANEYSQAADDWARRALAAEAALQRDMTTNAAGWRQNAIDAEAARLAAEAERDRLKVERDTARAGRAEAERENKRLDRELTAALAGQVANVVRREEANAYGDAEHARALAAEAKRDALREALAPFAEAAAAYDPDEGDGANVAWMHDFTIASLRRARALTQETADVGE